MSDDLSKIAHATTLGLTLPERSLLARSARRRLALAPSLVWRVNKNSTAPSGQ
jgi:hypothetical protein